MQSHHVTKHDQAGFSAIEAILVVLVVAVLAGSGFVVYKRYKLSSTKSNTATTQNQTATPTPIPPASTVTYLTIKEWGVKLPLADAIKDAYYIPAVGSSKGPDGQPNTLLLGLRSLDSSGCAATNTTAFAQIFRALPTEKDGVTGRLLTQEYPNGVTIGNYFYAYEGVSNTGTCKAPQATILSVDSAFATSTVPRK